MNTHIEQARSRVIGLDIHPSCFSASAFAGRNIQEAKHLWSHDKVDMVDLTRWAKKRLEPTDIIVMEACNNAFECCKDLQTLGFRALVLESYAVGKIGESHLKNDLVDSMKIAQVYLSGLAKEVWQPDEICRERRELLSIYQRATKDCTRVQNRLTAWATQHRLARPVGMSWRSLKAESWMLRQRAWSATQRMLIEGLFADLKHTHSKKSRVEAHIAEIVTSDPILAKVLQICGLRHLCVFALAASVGEISRFKNAKKLVAYLGLNPRVHESGISKKSGRLSNNGRKDIRHFLVQGAHSILKQDPASNRLARWGQSLIYRKGKNIAAIAVARKLVVAAWYLMSGFKAEVNEPTPALKVKLGKIGTVIGKTRLNQLGYPRREDFIQEKMKLVLRAT